MACSKYISTKETTHAARVSRLLVDPCTDLFRDILRNHVTEIQFPAIILQERNNLNPILNKVQRETLYPKSGTFNGTYADFDLSLLYILLRNISGIPPHQKGWAKTPDPLDRSLSANIDRIREIRNTYCGHAARVSLTDVEFNKLWQDLTIIISELESSLPGGCTTYTDAAKVIKIVTMDPEQEKKFLDEIDKHHQTTDDLKGKITEVIIEQQRQGTEIEKVKLEQILQRTDFQSEQECQKKEIDDLSSNLSKLEKLSDYERQNIIGSEGVLHANPTDQADVLNKQFQSVFSEKTHISTEEFTRDCPMSGKHPVAPELYITHNGILRLLKNLNPYRAAGPDGIKPRVLKELADSVTPILTIIFRKSLKSGEIQLEWRKAHVSPIFKKGDRYKAENYRPITLTCICCKLMEHIITSHIMQHADTNNILYPLQHGFRSKRSCESQLIEFIDDITNHMAAGKQTDVLIIDFSKAFDKVSHSLLIHKLRHYGIQGKVHNWIASFLSNRTQAVVVDGEMSSYVNVDSGVLQRSVLGPCLFLFYINDMPEGLNATVRLFADDTIAYLTVTSELDTQTLQADLDKLGICERKWKMKFHPDKCNVLSVSRKPNPIHHQYKLHGHTLEHVKRAKYLGCLITSDLKWSDHISNICSKGNKTLGFLRRNLNISSTSIKENAYKSLVRPQLEYAAPVWDPYTQKDTHNLEMVQRRAARYVSNRHGNRSSVDSMIQHLQWQTLEERRRISRLVLFYKIVHDEVVVTKHDRLIPPLRRSRHTHQEACQLPSCKRDHRKFSYFTRSIKEWNHLPPEIVMAKTLETFKSQVTIYMP
ncbi:uncharacterized protein LOC134254977 [Saccostrea cucullata]|uniref:uncharacterized protein LOC134254977 n=1 Tax=Saccostrea cuccullata TaxID=36930 RepID=UPI002ED1187D